MVDQARSKIIKQKAAKRHYLYIPSRLVEDSRWPFPRQFPVPVLIQIQDEALLVTLSPKK